MQQEFTVKVRYPSHYDLPEKYYPFTGLLDEAKFYARNIAVQNSGAVVYLIVNYGKPNEAVKMRAEYSEI